MAYTIIFIILLITFVFFSYLKMKQGENAQKYPKDLSCESIHSLFGTANKTV